MFAEMRYRHQKSAPLTKRARGTPAHSIETEVLEEFILQNDFHVSSAFTW